MRRSATPAQSLVAISSIVIIVIIRIIAATAAVVDPIIRPIGIQVYWADLMATATAKFGLLGHNVIDRTGWRFSQRLYR